MAREFDGISDIIRATVTAVNTGDWTMGCWAFPNSAGEVNLGGFISIGTAPSVQLLRISGTLRIQAQQAFATADANAESNNNALTLSIWQCIIATFRAADQKCRLFRGTLTTPMAELAYAANTAGTGSRTTGATALQIGNRDALDRTWDGSLFRPFLLAEELTLAQMEQYRLGSRILAGDPTIRGFWPLDSPNTTRAEDISVKVAHGTVSGATVTENPPLSTPNLSYLTEVLSGVVSTNHPLLGHLTTHTNLKAGLGTPQALVGRTRGATNLNSNLGGAEHHLTGRTYSVALAKLAGQIGASITLETVDTTGYTNIRGPLSVTHSLIGRVRPMTNMVGNVNVPIPPFVMQPTRIIIENPRTQLQIEHRS